MTHTLADLLGEVAAERPSLTLGADDQRTTMDEAYEQATSAARRLHGWGLGPGDRVALIAPNSLEYIVAWMASQLAGLELATVNPSYPVDLLRQMFDVLGPKALLSVGGSASSDLGIPVLDAGDIRSGLVRDQAGGAIAAGEHPLGTSRTEASVAGFMHTSGTTGPPKFCVQSHRYFLSLASFVSGLFDLTAGDVVLAPLPLFHINPLGYGLLGALWGRSDFLTATKFSVTRFWPSAVDERVSVAILHGAPISLLKRFGDPAWAAGHSVRATFFGDHEFLQRFTIPEAITAYGSTEAGGISHTHRWSRTQVCTEPEGQMHYAGASRPDIDWTLRDGEILVRARSTGILFDGYLADGGVVDVTDEQGWFHTGDLGRQTESGDLVFVERLSESVRIKGEYVPLEHLETTLAAALASPVSAWTRPGPDGDELVVFVEGRIDLERYRPVEVTLPAFMRPVAFAEVEQLPRDDGVGKVQRRRLDDQTVRRWVEFPGAERRPTPGDR